MNQKDPWSIQSAIEAKQIYDRHYSQAKKAGQSGLNAATFASNLGWAVEKLADILTLSETPKVQENKREATHSIVVNLKENQRRMPLTQSQADKAVKTLQTSYEKMSFRGGRLKHRFKIWLSNCCFIEA